jgi:hypothetical protein
MEDYKNPRKGFKGSPLVSLELVSASLQKEHPK